MLMMDAAKPLSDLFGIGELVVPFFLEPYCACHYGTVKKISHDRHYRT